MTAEEIEVLKTADASLETAVDADAVAEAQFEAGFAGTPDSPTELPPVVEETVIPVVVVEPSLAKITEAQFQDLLSKANSVDEVKQTLEKLRGDAFGKLGGVERTLKQIQEQSTSPTPVAISKEDLAEIHAEFPDLAANIEKGLTRVLGKIKGGSSAPIDVDAKIAERDAKWEAQRAIDRESDRTARALERLADRHEDWSDVIGAPESKTPFRTWLAAQDATYADSVNRTDNPIVVAKALDMFKASLQKKPTVVPNGNDARADRLKEAIPAKGGASAPAQKRALTAEEQFELGYKAGRQ